MKQKKPRDSKKKSIPFRITRKVKKSGTIQWEVYCGRKNGKRIRKTFRSEAEAETYRELAINLKRNHGIAALTMPEGLRLEAVTCSERLEAVGATLTQATEHFLLHHRQPSDQPLFKDIAAEVLQKKIRANRKTSYTDGLGWTYGVFNSAFGDRKISEITADEIEDWVWDMEYAPATIRGYLRDVGQVFRYAVKREYRKDNPCALIERPEDDDKPTAIFAVEQVANILYQAVKHADLDLLVAFAIAFFAGLRSCEIAALDWCEIHLERGFIEVTKRKSKTRQRRIVTIQPNLRAFLEPHRRLGGPVVPSNWWNRRREFRHRIYMADWPRNVARHSFVSHHYQCFGNENLTAAEAGHSAQVLQQHYRELVSPDDARAYWNIFPDEERSSQRDAA